MLDAPEYLHLAIHASNEGNHHAALNYLKDALQAEPENAQILYFLAAEHAELGLYDRACSEMQAALELEPDLHSARFQLGLLHLQLGRPDDAKDTFEVLAKSAEGTDLAMFAAGYLKIIASEVPEALVLLQAGIASTENGALKADMLRVVASLSEGDIGQTDTPDDKPSPVFLGAYRDTTENN